MSLDFLKTWDCGVSFPDGFIAPGTRQVGAIFDGAKKLRIFVRFLTHSYVLPDSKITLKNIGKMFWKNIFFGFSIIIIFMTPRPRGKTPAHLEPVVQLQNLKNNVWNLGPLDLAGRISMSEPVQCHNPVYATSHLAAGGRHNETIPWWTNPLSSRSFIFSDLYRCVFTKLWHD